MSAPDGFTWQYRNEGEHDWRRAQWTGSLMCLRCGWWAAEAPDDPRPCPSVQERRLVGPWEPVSGGGEAP